ncbi:hypothetical protein RCR19_20025 [Streptomyces sp. WAC07094]|uniref:right-handed parallel beta-helix repeat-containing protein n=1 Tax=unclassified Streptomyces TaxID=2593676 RepID=UPI002ECEF528|nr:hypothetical protein [Streptomyces sp. WAC07094]
MLRLGVLTVATTAVATVVALPGPAYAKQFVACSSTALRNAITQANNTPGPAILHLSRGCTYTLTAADNPGNGLPIVTSEITVLGNNSNIRRQSATGFRLLEVGPTGNLTLNDLTLRDGRSDSSGGGAILNRGGTLSLNTVELTRNVSDAAGVGGAVNNAGGTLIARNSTVSFNISTNNGGGISSQGTANLSNTTITGNTARDSAGGMDARGNLTLSKSRVTDNSSGQDAGGLLAFDVTGTVWATLVRGNTSADSGQAGGGINSRGSMLTLERTTVFANRAIEGQGGGIAADAGSSLTIRNSSVTNNFADDEPGGIFNNGGTVSLTATPVVDNFRTNCAPSVVPGCTN